MASYQDPRNHRYQSTPVIVVLRFRICLGQAVDCSERLISKALHQGDKTKDWVLVQNATLTSIEVRLGVDIVNYLDTLLLIFYFLKCLL